jgi:hypothetical protein
MNLIFKALNDILIVVRNTVSMFLPPSDTKVVNDAKPPQTTSNVDIYPHNHSSTSTAVKSAYKVTKTDVSYPIFPLTYKDFPSWNKEVDENSISKSVKVNPYSKKIWISKTDPAIARLKRAVNNKGINPKFHDKLMKKHRKEWPELWAAIDALLKENK